MRCDDVILCNRQLDSNILMKAFLRKALLNLTLIFIKNLAVYLFI